MTRDEAVRFALRLLMVASEFDSATGGINLAAGTFATLMALESEGIIPIDGTRQAEILGS
jgi:hypothetical protein